MRLNKYIAHCGYCSRRSADQLIRDGNVSVNNKIVLDFNTSVTMGDKVTVKKQILSLNKPQIWLYHKPIGVVSSKKDPQGRQTVFEQLPTDLQHLISIGRLDMHTEGLLLMTNNGDISEFMTNPQNNIERKYKIRAFGNIDEMKINRLKTGITIDNIYYRPLDIHITQQTNNNHWFSVTLTEGKNREIRNIFKFLDLKISRLIRLQYGKFVLGNLKTNQIIQAPTKIVNQYNLMRACK